MAQQQQRHNNSANQSPAPSPAPSWAAIAAAPTPVSSAAVAPSPATAAAVGAPAGAAVAVAASSAPAPAPARAPAAAPAAAATAAAAAAAGGAKPAGAGSKSTPIPTLEQKLAKCQKFVGFRVTLTLLQGSEGYNNNGRGGGAPKNKTLKLQGIVYAAWGSLLMLQEPNGIRLVDINALHAFEVTKEADGSSGQRKIVDLQPPPVTDVHIMTKKLLEAKEKREKMLSNRNPHASALAQRIFDDLQKTFTCHWQETTICIRDLDVRLPEPYTAEAITGTQKIAVERVKIMVEQMHLSAEEEEESPKSAAATVAAPE